MMDSQVKSVHDQYPEGDEHHEKKSVLKKVKAKAKKIKNTITSKTHGHGHDDQEHHEEDDDEEYDEVGQDPEVHGAPMYDSAAATKGHHQDVGSGANLGPKAPLDQHVTDRRAYGAPTPPFSATGHTAQSGQLKPSLGEHFGEDLSAPKQDTQHVSPTNYPTKATHPGAANESAADQNFPTMGHHQDASSGVNLGPKAPAPLDLNPDHHVTDRRAYGAPTPPNSATEQLKHSLGGHFGEDLSAPKHDTQHVSPANHQTKATASGAAGGEEAGVAPILQKLDRMHVYDEPQKKNESVPESFSASTPENHPQDMNVDTPPTQPQPQQGGGYISSVTSAAIAAKNVVASKIGYGGSGSNQSAGSQTDQSVGSQTHHSAEPQTTQSAQPSSYTEKLSSATYAVAGKAALAKNVMASKLGYGGSTESHPTAADQPEINRGGEDNAKSGGGVSGYGQQIAGKLAPVYGTVAGAGSAVMSKMPGMGAGAGAGTGTGTGSGFSEKLKPGKEEINRGEEDNAKSGGGVSGYGRQIAGKLAPVYGTVAGAGSAVMSKMPGMGAGAGTGTGTGTGTGYFSEKLKPGEEDKALSDVITGAFGKRGVQEEHKKTGVGSDAIHKRNTEDEDVDREKKPMGRVTESEEVAKRLGTSEEEKSGEIPRDESSEGVVEKFKGAFTNWFGKGGEMNPSQAFNDHSQTQGTGEQEQQGISREGGKNLVQEGEMK